MKHNLAARYNSMIETQEAETKLFHLFHLDPETKLGSIFALLIKTDYLVDKKYHFSPLKTPLV